ncbi:GNAT family N-acetyltransferase [Bacillus subtilis]|uniref:GNAT family N-acetyltransferase n=1 Tax=Bacillus subtilis group TaxID=653685 RepID=UPI0006967411|nr:MULTISPECIES: GNAT family N-acetyltransferase [Bacillus subtilis group]MCY8307183.1 GNAT family N-acetyltransferase [Bacillus vallismortis]MCY8330769.1 GNAT family N-acetyltransferase [Bacillus spizizenii]
MEKTLYKESLTDEHKSDIEKFQCNKHEDIVEFLTEKALIYHYAGNSRTFLYYDEDDNLISFYSLFNDHVTISKKSKEKYKWTLPNLDMYPAIRLHYFAVDSRYQKKKFGKYMMGEVFTTCARIAADSGCNFIVLQAKENAIGFYKKLGFKSTGDPTKDGFQTMIFKLAYLEESS